MDKAITEAIARAKKCAPSSERDAVLANLNGKAYRRLEDIETDLRQLEARSK